MPYSKEELAIAAMARQGEAEKELTDRAFRAGLKSAARWFRVFPGDHRMPAGVVADHLDGMIKTPDAYFYAPENKEDDNATDTDSPA